MTKILSALVLVSLLAHAETKLFNGKNMDGWKAIGRDQSATALAGFEVKDGLLQTTSGKGLLWFTKQKIGNATIKVVYKMSNEKGNSGVFIRIPIEPQNEDDAINKGIEVQIDNRDDDWHATGVLYSMTKAMARPIQEAGRMEHDGDYAGRPAHHRQGERRAGDRLRRDVAGAGEEEIV